MERSLLAPRLGAVLGVLLLASPFSSAAQELYDVVDLGSLDPAYHLAYPYAINDAGDVAGVSFVLDGGIARPTAFLWRGGTMQPLGSDAYYSWAYGLNDDGAVVGGLTPPLRVSPSHAAILAPGPITDLNPLLGAGESEARDVNESGQIVGTTGSVFSRRAFLINGGVAVDVHAELAQYLGGGIPNLRTEALAINRRGEIVGSFASGTGRTAFVRRADGSYETLNPGPGGESVATCINDDGTVGGASGPSDGAHAVVWSGSSVTDLGTLGSGFASGALGINSRGDVVGASQTGEGTCPSACFWVEHAFLYRDGTMMDLNDLIPADSGWVLWSANAINDRGQIVAAASNADGDGRAVLLVPSPAGALRGLIERVLDLDLPKGTENSLVSKLENAVAALEAGDVATACGLLGAFIHECEAQSGKKIGADDADRLIATAQAIRGQIGCP